MAPRLIAAKDVTTEPKRGFRAGSMSGQCFFIIPETKRARLPNFLGGQMTLWVALLCSVLSPDF